MVVATRTYLLVARHALAPVYLIDEFKGLFPNSNACEKPTALLKVGKNPFQIGVRLVSPRYGNTRDAHLCPWHRAQICTQGLRTLPLRRPDGNLGAHRVHIQRPPHRPDELLELRLGLDRRGLGLEDAAQLVDAALGLSKLVLRAGLLGLGCGDLVVVLEAVAAANEGDKRQER